MRKVAIIIIVTIVLSAITYAGGGIVVTQGNCCGGGGVSGAADGVGIYHAKAGSLLSNFDDSTIVDGGIATMHTLKDLQGYNYDIRRNDGSSQEIIFITDSLTGYTTVGMGAMSPSTTYIQGVVNVGYAMSNMILAQSAYEATGLYLDSARMDINYTNNLLQQERVIQVNDLGQRTSMSSADMVLDKFTITSVYSDKIVSSCNKPALTGNYDPKSYEILDENGWAYQNNPLGNPSYNGSSSASFGMQQVGVDEPYFYAKNNFGNYKIDIDGKHLFNNSNDTITAIFNGDIVCTGVNIPSDKKTKSNVTDVKMPGISSLTPKSFVYDYVFKRDTVYKYDTVWYDTTYMQFKNDYDKSNQLSLAEYDFDWIESKKGLYRKIEVRKYKTVKKIDYIKEYSYNQATHYGFMVEEVERVLPQAVTVDKNGEKYINYTTLQVAAVAETKAMQEIILQLLARVEYLESKLK